MELRLLNTNHMPDGWLANQLTGIWKDFARDIDNGHTDAPITPRADVIEDTDNYQFFFEMAGLKKDRPARTAKTAASVRRFIPSLTSKLET